MGIDIKKIRRKETAAYVLGSLSADLTKPFTLHVRPLSMETPEVFNDAFRKTDGDEVTPTKDATAFDTRTVNRGKNLETVARCCIASWDNVTEDGVPIECTPDSALRVLREIDAAGYHEEITTLISWTMNLNNFREPLESASSLGKE